MNRGLNLPAIQRIMNEFEKESATMDMKEEMMSDAVDDVMQDDAEDEEEEGDKILQQVLDEIGVTLQHQVCCPINVCTLRTERVFFLPSALAAQRGAHGHCFCCSSNKR